LARGVLTGKYAQGNAPADARMNSEMMKDLQRSTARTNAIVGEVIAVARECGRSPAQVALAWLRQRPVPVIPIIGARRLEQFRDNLACVDLRLDAPHMERLDSASAIELGFPHDLYRIEMARSLVSGGLRDRIDA
jgi:aryl-alcohol dehydrogenase-like predicted oxidoreductase